MFFTFAISAYAETDAHKLQIERAVVASGLFKKICFMMHSPSQTGRRIAFLNDKFPMFKEGGKQKFLSLVNVEQGDAWAASFPGKGNFVIVVDQKTTNCHVIVQKADGNIIHKKTKELFQEADKNLSGFELEYNPISKGPVMKSSGFDVKKINGTTLTAVVVSTPLKSLKNKPQAIMTVAVRSY